jgi:tetratricopeptide (TPR) repeat protein
MNAVVRSTIMVLGICLFAQSVLAQNEPLYEGLGTTGRNVTAANPEAAKYVVQGIRFLYGFSHGSAIRSFEQAAKLDPSCAMAYWGIAYANGPHVNFPLVPPPAAEAAWKNLALAKQNADKCTPVEKDLIDALAARYADPQPEDRSGLDKAYADTMRKVWQKHPEDADVGAWFAESMMDLAPWNQWSHEGAANPGTQEIIATLEAVMRLNINHPLANHLYIHAMEASLTPDKAVPAADRLRELQPALAHNVHMPTHIDIRVGQWQKAIDWNARAIDSGVAYHKVSGPPQGLLIFYEAHNYHMLAYAALMTGQRDLAMKQINAMVASLPTEFVKGFAPMIEGFGAMPDEVMVRFGMWDQILAAPQPDKDYMPYTNAFHHGARAIALAAKDKTTDARAEQAMWVEGIKKIPEGEVFHNNPMPAICTLASAMIEGEILVREGKTDQGLAKLREAVQLEDALHYDEPPAWMIPARHSLGAALMKANKYAEAEQVYRDDLKKLPNNGWSLYGLADALRQEGKADEAKTVDAQFKEVWAKADIQITTSCLCQASAK